MRPSGRGLDSADHPRWCTRPSHYTDVDARPRDDVGHGGAIPASGQSRLVMAAGVMADRSIVLRMRRSGALGPGFVVMVRRLIDRGTRELWTRRLCRCPSDHELRPVRRRDRVQPTDQHDRGQSDKKDEPADADGEFVRLQLADGVAHSNRTVPM